MILKNIIWQSQKEKGRSLFEHGNCSTKNKILKEPGKGSTKTINFPNKFLNRNFQNFPEMYVASIKAI